MRLHELECKLKEVLTKNCALAMEPFSAPPRFTFVTDLNFPKKIYFPFMTAKKKKQSKEIRKSEP